MINEYQARRYCLEDLSMIENYQEAVSDKTQTWDIHHRLEVQGKFVNSKKLLKRCGMYYNRPASEVIFLTRSEHNRLHKSGEKNPLFGKHRSEEIKKKISEAMTGEKNPLFGKHRSEQTKKKMSEYHWYTNGIKNVFARECPEGFMRGRK